MFADEYDTTERDWQNDNDARERAQEAQDRIDTAELIIEMLSPEQVIAYAAAEMRAEELDAYLTAALAELESKHQEAAA